MFSEIHILQPVVPNQFEMFFQKTAVGCAFVRHVFCKEQCRETKGAPRLSLAQAEEPEKAASFTVLDGLKGCEVALTAMDRRVTNLEDCLEDIGYWIFDFVAEIMLKLYEFNYWIYSEVCEIGEVVGDIKWKMVEEWWRYVKVQFGKQIVPHHTAIGALRIFRETSCKAIEF